MTNIYYKILLNGVEQQGTIDVTATDLISVHTELQKDFPGASILHFHVPGECDCGES
jgi:hypothetical protein